MRAIPWHSPRVSTPLPHRPWWRDDVTLVWRTDSSVCVGDGERRIVVTDVDHALISWLLSLRGQWTLIEALEQAEARGVGRRHPRRLLRAVATTGGLDDASVASDAWRDADTALRDRLDVERAAARHTHGSAQDAAAALDRRLRARITISGDGPVADAVAATLTASGIGRLMSTDAVRSTSIKGRRRAGAVACQVLCDSAHMEAAVDAESLALDVPHLPVSVHGARATVGPLVLPGRTSCLRCRDLHRADADSQWSRVAVQLQKGPRPVQPTALVQWAAAWASVQVLELVDLGAASVSAAGTEWTLTLPRGDIASATRPWHPLCGCRWWAA